MPFDFIEQRMRFNKFSLPQIKKIPSERQSYAQYHLPPYSNIPSGSPGNRFTLLCSQLSISLAASLCSSQHIAESATLQPDRKSTRLNSSHRCISYAVFCLKKKKKNKR